MFKPASVSSLINYKFFNNVADVKITLKIINMNECARHSAKYLIFIISILRTTLPGRFCYAHFTDEEIDIQNTAYLHIATKGQIQDSNTCMSAHRAGSLTNVHLIHPVTSALTFGE